MTDAFVTFSKDSKILFLNLQEPIFLVFITYMRWVWCQCRNLEVKIVRCDDIVTIKTPNFCNVICLRMKVHSSMYVL